MKRILVLTPVYPAQDIKKTDTSFVHYFVKGESEDGIRCTCSTLYGKFSTFAFWYIGAEKQAICLYVHEMI